MRQDALQYIREVVMEVFIVIDMGDKDVLACRAFDNWDKANQYITEHDNFRLGIARQYLKDAPIVYACHHYDEKRDAYIYRRSAAQEQPEYGLCMPLAVE
ncbi:MAG: hypothetical protein AAGU32_11855 [Bacillota bacterium]